MVIVGVVWYGDLCFGRFSAVFEDFFRSFRSSTVIIDSTQYKEVRHPLGAIQGAMHPESGLIFSSTQQGKAIFFLRQLTPFLRSMGRGSRFEPRAGKCILRSRSITILVGNCIFPSCARCNRCGSRFEPPSLNYKQLYTDTSTFTFLYNSCWKLHFPMRV